MIGKLGKKAGVSFNPSTPIDPLKHVLDLVDLVLIMSVTPGFGGQKFIQSAIPKISQAKNMVSASGRAVEIEVDGGVGPGNARSVKKAGADIIVAGSAVFGADNYKDAIDSIRDD
jgi:ribulose-phosphate 3-epimerase